MQSFDLLNVAGFADASVLLDGTSLGDKCIKVLLAPPVPVSSGPTYIPPVMTQPVMPMPMQNMTMLNYTNLMFAQNGAMGVSSTPNVFASQNASLVSTIETITTDSSSALSVSEAEFISSQDTANIPTDSSLAALAASASGQPLTAELRRFDEIARTIYIGNLSPLISEEQIVQVC